MSNETNAVFVTAVVNADNSITYTPNADFTGTDTFTFQASDGPLTSAVANFTVTVTAVNDPPVAVPDTLTVDQNSGPNPVDLLANDIDVDGEPLRAVRVVNSGPANGSLTLNEDGSFTYTPNAGFFGSDSFQDFPGLC